MEQQLLTIVTMLALIEFIWLGVRVGGARAKYSVPAPATTGDEMFERHYRVHYNTLEQLIVFVPALWALAIMSICTLLQLWVAYTLPVVWSTH